MKRNWRKRAKCWLSKHGIITGSAESLARTFAKIYNYPSSE